MHTHCSMHTHTWWWNECDIIGRSCLPGVTPTSNPVLCGDHLLHFGDTAVFQPGDLFEGFQCFPYFYYTILKFLYVLLTWCADLNWPASLHPCSICGTSFCWISAICPGVPSRSDLMGQHFRIWPFQYHVLYIGCMLTDFPWTPFFVGSARASR